MNSIRILEGGPLATVQDRGRFGFRDMGVPVSGAMDQQAFMVGNLLVGNGLGAASIEITLGGFKAEFLGEACFVVTGSDQAPRLALWESLPREDEIGMLEFPMASVERLVENELNTKAEYNKKPLRKPS